MSATASMKQSYLVFDKMPSTGKTEIYGVCNRRYGCRLGTIRWWSAWRQYCFFPENDDLVFSAGCMREIADYVERLTGERALALVLERTRNRADQR
jgi:hypothetical protein